MPGCSTPRLGFDPRPCFRLVRVRFRRVFFVRIGRGPFYDRRVDLDLLFRFFAFDFRRRDLGFRFSRRFRFRRRFTLDFGQLRLLHWRLKRSGLELLRRRSRVRISSTGERQVRQPVGNDFEDWQVQLLLFRP